MLIWVLNKLFITFLASLLVYYYAKREREKEREKEDKSKLLFLEAIGVKVGERDNIE
jgi:hypothetical protein